MTSIHALHAEAMWETESTRRAVHRYREAALSKSPHELPGGRRLLAEIIPPLASAIRLGQHEAQAMLPHEGRTPLWVWPLMSCDAEEIAVITLCTALRAVGDTAHERSGAGLATCLMVARVAQEQIQFDAWVEEQKKLNKANKEKKGAPTPPTPPPRAAPGDPTVEAPLHQEVGQSAREERMGAPVVGARNEDELASVVCPKAPHKDLLAALRNTHPDVDRRTWATWRRKLAITKAEPWDKPVALAFGGWLLEALARTSGGRITMGTRTVGGGRTETYVVLAPETEELLRDAEARAEVARPLRLPMLIPPNPWRYT